MCRTSGLKKSAVDDPCPGMGRYIWQDEDLAVVEPEPGVIEVADLGQEVVASANCLYHNV